jgi:hypothetical protein
MEKEYIAAVSGISKQPEGTLHGFLSKADKTGSVSVSEDGRKAKKRCCTTVFYRVPQNRTACSCTSGWRPAAPTRSVPSWRTPATRSLGMCVMGDGHASTEGLVCTPAGSGFSTL